MIDLSIRSNSLEKMDDLTSPETHIRENLRELEIINTRLGGYKPILQTLDQLLHSGKKYKILDVGCGGGDTLRAIDRWARLKQQPVDLVGVDYNPVMIDYAAARSAGANIRYRQLDVYDDAIINERPDIVTCCLFLHHFEHTDAVKVVKRMYELAGEALIINDLHRHWIAYYSIRLLTGLFSKTYMVKHDAPLSVARAFRRKDLVRLMTDAGIEHYSIKWHWAWRWLVVIPKNTVHANL